MLFSRPNPEREKVKVPDKQPEFLFEGKDVDAKIFDPTTHGMSGEEFGRAAKKILQRGLADKFEEQGSDTVEVRGMVAQRIPKRTLRSDESEIGNEDAGSELTVFEIEQRLNSIS